MLRTSNLSFSYSSDVSFSFPDIHLEDQEHLLILGQSGTGKTTLLHLLGGLLKPSAGSITIGTEDITKISGSKLDRYRGRNIGIVFQVAHFVASLNVKNNLLLAQNLAGVKQDSKRVKEFLDRLNLSHRINSKIQNLSIGEKQRVAIARALLNRPGIILADEPTSSLDDDNCTDVLQLLKEQAEIENSSLVIVTHDNRIKDQFNKTVLL